jgi:hypothetical protein
VDFNLFIPKVSFVFRIQKKSEKKLEKLNHIILGAYSLEGFLF